MAKYIRASLYSAKDYARWRRKSWRTLASGTHLFGLALSATATVILGLSDLDGPAQWGFIFSALVTTIGAIEPFFNWRSRWVLAEEALARWHRIEEDLSLYVANREIEKLDQSEVMSFYHKYTQVWEQFSDQWLEQRRADGK
ncbi:SLATT domain-containing protein [Arthrobacter sp. TMS2-4]